MIPESIENIYVTCNLANKELVYKNAYALIRDKRRLISKPEIEKPISVILFGIDSLSSNSLIRNMPETWSYLQSKEYWFNIPGYNRVGENTFPNLMTFLTGLKIISSEIPCNSKEVGGLDQCPFIWKDFHDNGYVTAYAEDATWMSSFNYLKKGFKDPPTDHYFRPYFQSVIDKLAVQKSGSPFCIGYKHGAEYVYDYMMDFVRRYKGSPYFGLFWVNSFSHNDPNLAFIMDYKISNYLKQLEKERFTEESVIIFLSDHGLRFGSARHTRAGAFEENLPMLNIWIPPKLREPSLLNNLKANQNRLVNPYDLYNTLFDILEKSGYTKDKTEGGCPNCKSIFKPISSNRTCKDIGIPSEFCACAEYKIIPPDSELVVQTANKIVNFMNGFKNSYQNGSFYKLCENLSVGKISDAFENMGKEDELKRIIVISFQTEPNNGLFEVTVKFPQNVTIPDINFQTISISRVNSYGNDSHCIKEETLLRFCYCGN
ncbi:hypothetical protein ACFFRR_003296 [Megaselia abdita]